MIDLLCAVLKVMSYESVDIFSGNKIAILYSLDILHMFVKLYYWNYSGDREPHVGSPGVDDAETRRNNTKLYLYI
jgi:hypothetical protein